MVIFKKLELQKNVSKCDHHKYVSCFCYFYLVGAGAVGDFALESDEGTGGLVGGRSGAYRWGFCVCGIFRRDVFP